MAHRGQEIKIIENVVHGVLQGIDIHVALHPVKVPEARIVIVMGMGPDDRID